MKVTSRRRALGRMVAVLVALEGCGVVVGLGDAKPLGTSSTVTVQRQAAQIAVGSSHACATINVASGSPENGSVLCWGSNAKGALGSDPAVLVSASTPQPVDGFPTGFQASSLALAAGTSCAISLDGFLFCWGGVPSEVPSGIHRQDPVPAYVPSSILLNTTQVQPVALASLDASGGCLVEADSLVCWGALAFRSGQDAGVDGGAAVSDPGFLLVAAGGANACALAVNDGVSDDIECWGDDTYGQSGGTVGGSLPDPSPIGLSGGVKQLAAGADFACALMNDGTVSCWGDNARGQLGPGAPAASSATPVPIPFAGSLKATALALGDEHACAVVDDSTSTFQNVECWGDNSTGQLGVGPSGPPRSATPLEVLRLSDGGSEPLPHVVRIAAGGGTTCVVRSTDALVSCWGGNESGQAGQPASVEVDYATPVEW